MTTDTTASSPNDPFGDDPVNDPVFANVRAPDRTYSDRLTVELGGQTVEMIHALPSHSDDSSIIFFPEYSTIFAVDFVNVRRVPFQNMGGGPVQP